MKRIPFKLKVGEFKEAFEIAVQNGDPDNINKVIKSIIESLARPDHATQQNPFQDFLTIISSVPDGLRHLYNYVKKRITYRNPLFLKDRDHMLKLLKAIN